MRRVRRVCLLVALVLAATACGASRPQLAVGTFDARHTLGAVSVLHVHRTLPGLLDTLAGFPEEGEGKEISEGGQFFSEQVREHKLETREGWQRIGVDPSAGVTLLLDRRWVAKSRIPMPIVVLRCPDDAPLRRFVATLDETELKVTPLGGGVALWRIGEDLLFVGRRDGWLYLGPALDAKAPPKPQAKRFAALLAAPQTTVSADKRYPLLTGDADAQSGWLAWIDAHHSAAFARALGVDVGRGFGWLMAGPTVKGAGLRLTMEPELTRAFTTALTPQHAAPDFAQRVPGRGMMYAQFSVDVGQLPARAAALAGRLGQGTLLGDMAANLAGMARAQKPLLSVFDGHGAVAWRLEGSQHQKGMQFLFMAGLSDTDKALANVEQTMAGLVAQGAARRLGKATAWSVFHSSPLAGYTLAIDGDMMLGTNSELLLEAALTRSTPMRRRQSLARTVAGKGIADSPVLGVALDSGAAMRGIFENARRVDLGPWVEGVSKKVGGRTQASGADRWLRLAFDRHGMRVSLAQRSAVTAVDLLIAAAGVWGPTADRVKHKERAEFAKGVLQELGDRAFAYYRTPRKDPKTGQRLPCRFPASGGFTPPAKSCCAPEVDRDGDGQCDANTQAWATPVWRALDASLTAPTAFQFRFESSGEGASARFVITARADQDCDGVYAIYRYEGTGDPKASLAGCGGPGTTRLNISRPFE